MLSIRPLVRRVKRDLRDAFWYVRGARLHLDRRLDAPVRSVLFVCKGNICRSPFAAAVARRSAAAVRLRDLEIASAGLRVPHSIASPEDAVAAAGRCGIDMSGHRSAPLTPEMLGRFDLIVVMEPWQGAALEALGVAAEKWALLSMFEGNGSGWRSRAYERYHVEDPYGHGPESFNRCFRRVQSCVDALVGACAATQQTTRGSLEMTCQP
jgi:protein-tyrosine phosphatase